MIFRNITPFFNIFYQNRFDYALLLQVLEIFKFLKKDFKIVKWNQFIKI